MLSHDLENDPDIVAMIGCLGRADHFGRALHGPDRGCPRRLHRRRVCAEPARSTQLASRAQLDLVVAGTDDGVMMVESEANELSEEIMLGAVMFGHERFQPVIDVIIDLAEACAKEPWIAARTPSDSRR